MSAEGSSRRAVDPQILSDVAAGPFMIPGRDMLRSMRIQLFSSSLVNVACGGRPFPDLDATAGRYEQAVFADVDLIAEKGLVEERDPNEAVIVEGPPGCAPSLPHLKAWRELATPWRDAVQTALQAAPVQALLPSVATCLQARSGLSVAPANPTASFLGAADVAALGAPDRDARMVRYSRAYATCTRSYFAAIADELVPVRAELVERNRELLEATAQELAAAGYVP